MIPDPEVLRGLAARFRSTSDAYTALRARYQVALERLYGEGGIEGERASRLQWVVEPFVGDAAHSATSHLKASDALDRLADILADGPFLGTGLEFLYFHPGVGQATSDLAAAGDAAPVPGDRRAVLDSTSTLLGMPRYVDDEQWWTLIPPGPPPTVDSPVPFTGNLNGVEFTHAYAFYHDGHLYFVELQPGERPDRETLLRKLDAAAQSIDDLTENVGADLVDDNLDRVMLFDSPNRDGHAAHAIDANNTLAIFGLDPARGTTVDQPDLDPIMGHEFGHLVDAGASASPQWQLIQAVDQAHNSSLDGQVPVDPNYPLGQEHLAPNTPNDAEDYANSFGNYFLDQERGYLYIDPATGTEVRFRDLYPGRADYFDNLTGR